jgi:hypothetical protein
MREVKLPSGAVLKLKAAAFPVSKALYQAVLEELREIPISAQTQMASVYKDMFCVGFSSKKVEECLKECFKCCQYCDGRGDLKIDDDTFEPVAARDDYLTVCMEVAKENINPFGKSLYAEYGKYLEMILNGQS